MSEETWGSETHSPHSMLGTCQQQMDVVHLHRARRLQMDQHVLGWSRRDCAAKFFSDFFAADEREEESP